MSASKSATIEREVSLGPINVGVVLLKPIQPENDWIRDGNDRERPDFLMIADGYLSNDVLGDQSRSQRTVVDGHDRDRCFFEFSRQ